MFDSKFTRLFEEPLGKDGNVKKRSVLCILIYALIFPLCFSSDEKIKGKRTPLEMYRGLFEEHRYMQLEAVKSIQKFEDYKHRYSLIEMTLKKLFTVTLEAKQNLTLWGFVPGDPFPENDTIKEAVSKVLENTALFGDLILRNPDIGHAIYDKNKDWQHLLGWSYWFSKESGVFEGGSATLLNLMAQEVNLIPKESNYVNPFKIENQLKRQQLEKEQLGNSKPSKAAKKMKEKMKNKGPRLSGRKTEL